MVINFFPFYLAQYYNLSDVYLIQDRTMMIPAITISEENYS